MEFSLNTSNENCIFNEVQQSLVNEDASYISKSHLNFCDENLGQSSLNGWSLSPDLTDISNRYQKNPIPSIPYQNQDFLNRNLVTTPNHLVYNSPSYEIPSNHPFGNTLWDETEHNKELTKKGSEQDLDQMIGETQSFDMPVLEGMRNTTNEIMNQCEDQKMIKTYPKKDKKVVSTSKHLKKGNIIKRIWTKAEDKILRETVGLDEPKKWATIAKNLEGRTGKQCRERWHNYLRSDIKKGAWTEEEDQILVEAHKLIGTKWVKIAQQLPGRSSNSIKNHWNTRKRRVQKQISENVNPADNNILENYIRYVIDNNDDHSKTTENDGETTNTEDDNEFKDMFVEEMNLSLEARAQTNEPLVVASTTSPYVPMLETCIWDNTTEFCAPMDDILMDWWK